MMKLEPLVAVGVLASTALTDAVYVLFNAAVAQRRRLQAATWSSIWYLLSAFAVISQRRPHQRRNEAGLIPAHEGRNEGT
jgi:hypothetical protein